LGCSLTNCAWSCHRSCAGEVERSAASSVNSCLWTAQNVQSLQTGDCLPMQSLRWSRLTGHDHYRNVRQSDPQIQHSQLDNWAADLRHRLPTAERFSATGFYGISVEADHSGLMLAARITLAHFSVSSIKSFPNSVGDNGMGTFPRPVMRSLTLGSDRPVLISRLSLSIIACGVPPRHRDSIPSARFVTWHNFPDGWNVG